MKRLGRLKGLLAPRLWFRKTGRFWFGIILSLWRLLRITSRCLTSNASRAQTIIDQKNFFFFFFSFFSFFLQPCLHCLVVMFANWRHCDTLSWSLDLLSLCLASWHFYQRYSLPFWRFLGKSLNFREFKTFTIGGNHSRSRYFPFLKPTHSVILY